MSSRSPGTSARSSRASAMSTSSRQAASFIASRWAVEAERTVSACRWKTIGPSVTWRMKRFTSSFSHRLGNPSPVATVSLARNTRAAFGLRTIASTSRVVRRASWRRARAPPPTKKSSTARRNDGETRQGELRREVALSAKSRVEAGQSRRRRDGPAMSRSRIDGTPGFGPRVASRTGHRLARRRAPA